MAEPAPLLSVITPSFNSGRFIGETLESVAALESPHEHLVVDGGSSDTTVATLQAREDPRLHWVSEPDRGQTHAVNKGLAQAKGELVGWLNADDTYVPAAVDAAVQRMRDEPAIDAVFGFLDVINADGESQRQYRCGRFNWLRYLYAGDYVATPTIVFRRALLERGIELDERYKDAADYDFYLRLLRGARVELIREPLVRFRFHDQSKTGSNIELQYREAMEIRLTYARNGRQAAAMRGIRKIKALRERVVSPWPEADADPPDADGEHHAEVPSALSSGEANRRFYRDHAHEYDETEFCAIDEEPRRMLRSLLERGLELAPDDPAVLDAGGGTGNASLLLREMGIDATLVDTSPEMIARYEKKAVKQGYKPRTELVDLESFFGKDERRWDLVVFSSVLHHLEDPAAVLAAAAARLHPGGVIVTVFDPLAVDRLGMFLRKLDYACWIAIHSPGTLARALARRLPSRGAADETQLNIGELAERHAMSGLDDDQIRLRVESAGLTVSEHQRIHDARHDWIVSASRGFRRPTHFSFIFQRPQAGVR